MIKNNFIYTYICKYSRILLILFFSYLETITWVILSFLATSLCVKSSKYLDCIICFSSSVNTSKLSLINILVSIIFTRFTGISLFYSIFPMITGIIFILFSYSENLKSKKQIILILSIFLLAVSPLSSFINLFFISEIDKETKRSRSPNIDIDPEIKRIDILIKIGISLIILSCLIFIFSDWNIFNKMIVSIFLIIFTLIFYLLYKLFSIKIILPSSQKLYYILYNSFIVLTFLALGYYKFFGNYFSPLGLGKNIFYTVLLLVISIILNNVKKFSNSILFILFVGTVVS